MDELHEYDPKFKKTYLQHARYMARQIPKFVQAGRMSKTDRWYGFLQGLLVTTGVISMNQAKIDNMPEGETFSRDA